MHYIVQLLLLSSGDHTYTIEKQWSTAVVTAVHSDSHLSTQRALVQWLRPIAGFASTRKGRVWQDGIPQCERPIGIPRALLRIVVKLHHK